MNQTRLRCVLAGLLSMMPLGCVFATKNPENAGAGPAAADIARLEKGEVILLDQTYKDAAGKTRGKGMAIVLVGKPPAEAWTHLSNFSSYAEFMPRLTRSKVYLDTGKKVGVDFTLKVLFKRIRYYCLHDLDKAKGLIRWQLDASKKNDIALTTGYWRVRAHGKDKSILTYTVAVDTGMAVPRVIQDFLTKRDLPNVVRAMKKRIETAKPREKE